MVSRWWGLGGGEYSVHGEFYQLMESTLCISTHGSVQCTYTTVIFSYCTWWP